MFYIFKLIWLNPIRATGRIYLQCNARHHLARLHRKTGVTCMRPGNHFNFFWRINMNAKKLIAAVAVFAAAGSAFAIDGETPVEQKNFVSSKSRADVMAEIAQARAQGMPVGGEAYPAAPMIANTGRTRAEVSAEARQTDINRMFIQVYGIGA
jgi:hypothetical protein